MATDDVGCTAKSILRVIIFLGPQCPCVGERKAKRNPSSCSSSPLYRIPLPFQAPRGLLRSSWVLLSVTWLFNSFLPPLLISRALPIRYMPLPFSALVSLVFYISTAKGISSPWTAVSMWHSGTALQPSFSSPCLTGDASLGGLPRH
jgi:hypothetical protein